MTDTPTGGAEPRVPPDPIYRKSYSIPIAVASVALVGAVALAVADEVWFRRPYKAYQADYKRATLAYLDQLSGERKDFEKALRALPEFQELDAKVKAETEATEAARVAAVNAFNHLDARSNALKEALRVFNSEISALVYDAEHAAHGAGDKEALQSEAARPYREKIERIRNTQIEVVWDKVTITGAEDRTLEDGTVVREETKTTERVTESGTVGDLQTQFLALQEEKGRAQGKIGDALAPRNAAVRARDAWLAANVGSIQKWLEHGGPNAELLQKRLAEVGAKRFVDAYTTPVSAAVVAKERARLDAMPTGAILGGEIQPYQIHLKDTANWVDRCEVCHSGARSVVPVSGEQLRDAARAAGWPERELKATKFDLYASHPRAAELFAHHDPDKMGCSTCHNGNGIAITSAFEAHGQNHHWLWPLHPKENLEAGCVQCHQKDVHLATGPQITRARDTFQEKGCWGCHPYEGYDPTSAEITKVNGRISELERATVEAERRREAVDVLARSADPDKDPAAAQRLADERTVALDAFTQQIAQHRTEIDQQRRALTGLWNERQRVGPSWKELRVGMRPEVLTPWVNNPRDVRPDTKMPVPRWWGGKDADGLDEEAKDVAAFIWQKGSLDPAKHPELRISAPQGGSAGRGKEIFRTIGCLSCHSVEEAGKTVGGRYAANLSDVGEKKTYEWIYRWIRDPQHRLVGYSSAAEKDVSGAEAEAAAERGHLVTRTGSPMPDFRLDENDARDVATYLASLRRERSKPWPNPSGWLNDPARAERGRNLVLLQGCAGCHEVAGMEKERGIGTPLTNEGSKPLDRLDFGHWTTHAKRGTHEPLRDWTSSDGVKVFAEEEEARKADPHDHGWYRPRGFFMHKIAKPDVFDEGRYFADRTLRSRMPQFQLTAQELHDLTTLLLGSVDSRLPESSRYNPGEAGRAVRDGWWLVKKYNCEGCHQIEPGQVPTYQELPWWTPEERATNAFRDRHFPPTLVGAGFRLEPNFLTHFLADPSLGGGDERPKSVRRHLEARMPTFHFTESEVAALVRFFEAKSSQPPVRQRPQLPQLSAPEKAAAEAIWVAANCLQCHVVGETPITAETKAPDLAYVNGRLRPEWMARWIPRPQELMLPSTSMTNNFERADDKDPHSRWVFTDKTLPELGAVPDADHVDLMVRYLLEVPGARR